MSDARQRATIIDIVHTNVRNRAARSPSTTTMEDTAIQLTAGFVVPRLFDENNNSDLLPPEHVLARASDFDSGDHDADTAGAAGADDDEAWQGPIVQICSIRPIDHERQRRYRLIVSDGHFFTQMMLFTSLNRFVEDGAVCKHCVVSLDSFGLYWVDEGRTRK